jgi:hypothetical protein
MINKAILIWS